MPMTRRTMLGASLGVTAAAALAACGAPPAPTAAPAKPAAAEPTKPAAAEPAKPAAAEPTKPAAGAPAAATTPAAAAPAAATSAPAATKPAETAKPAAGGRAPLPRIKVGQSTFVLTLDPTGSQNAPSYQATVLTSGQLYRFDLDKKPQPDLVDRAEVAADARTIRMTLKPGLTYSDGTPLRASDAVHMLELQRKGQGATFFAPVDSVEAPDDATLIWKLKAPYPDFFNALALHYLLLHPKEKIANPDAAKEYFKKPVSAGPYVVKDWTPGTNRMLLEANPKYVGGEMMAREVELSAVADLTSRVLQLATGALDWAFDLPASARESLPKEVTAGPNPLGGVYHVTVNLERPGPLQDPKVRQAMSLAIDREAVSAKAFFGISKPLTGFMYSDVPEHEAALPNGGKRDVEAARRLLAQTPHAAGFEFKLQSWGARAGWKEAALVIADNLKEIGIKASVEPLEDAVIVANSTSGNYEAMWTGTIQLPLFALNIMYVEGGSWANAARYKNPRMKELLGQAQVEPDAGKRKEILSQVYRIAAEDMPHIPISERVVLTGSRLKDDVLTTVRRAEYIRVKSVKEMGSA
jgi:ABC-type transport system substrate-binding protein